MQHHGGNRRRDVAPHPAHPAHRTPHIARPPSLSSRPPTSPRPLPARPPQCSSRAPPAPHSPASTASTPATSSSSHTCTRTHRGARTHHVPCTSSGGANGNSAAAASSSRAKAGSPFRSSSSSSRRPQTKSSRSTSLRCVAFRRPGGDLRRVARADRCCLEVCFFFFFFFAPRGLCGAEWWCRDACRYRYRCGYWDRRPADCRGCSSFEIDAGTDAGKRISRYRYRYTHRCSCADGSPRTGAAQA